MRSTSSRRSRSSGKPKFAEARGTADSREASMRSHSRAGLVLLALVVVWPAVAAAADGPPKRKALDAKQREAVLSLIKAVDTAQQSDASFDEALAWDGHVMKAGEQSA